MLLDHDTRRVASLLGASALAAALALAGCGGDSTPADARASATASNVRVPQPASDTSATSEPSGPPILIRTAMNGLTGKVMAGSELGESPFCPGGSVRHDHGSPELGFPAVNVFHCSDGDLKIGFGPGPDQMNNAFQTSSWEVLEGTGTYAALTGRGQMVVKFTSAGAVNGQETFLGRLDH
jgi:hypothetical protein